MRKNTRSSNSTSNSEVTAGNSRAWFVFLLGLFLSTFFGGAFRAFLSPTQLSAWVEKKLTEKDPKFYLNFKHLEFKLADGSIPMFGLYAKDLSFSSKNPCLSRSELTISEVYIPISIASVFSKVISFSAINAGIVEFVYKDPICNASQEEPPTLLPPTPLVESVEEDEGRQNLVLSSFREFVENRFLKELENSRKWFDTLSFSELRLIYGEKKAEALKLNNFHVDLNRYENKVFISSDLQFQSQKIRVDDIKPLAVEAVVSQQEVTIRGAGRYKEGELLVHGLLSIPTEKFNLTMNSQYFPVGEIIKSFKEEVKGLPKGLNPRLLWFSCQASAEGFVGEYKNMTLKIDNCGVRGAAGKLHAKSLVVHPFLEKQTMPIEVSVENFSLGYLVEVFGGKIKPNTVASWGKLFGRLVYDEQKFNFIGRLKNIETVFSHHGKKRLQLIHQAEGELSLHNQRVSGIINKLDIDGGNFEGELSFNLDKDFNSGVIQFNIVSFLLNKSIIKLLINAETSPLQLFGKLSLKNGELEEWQGILGISKITDIGFTLEKFKIDTKFSQDFWDLRLRGDTLKVQDESYLYNDLKKLFIVEESPELFSFNDFQANFKIYSNSGTWSQLSANDAKLKLIMSSEGKWEGDSIFGWLNVEKSDYKWLPWEITGKWGAIDFTPSIKLLKAIRPDNSTVNLDESLNKQQKEEAFNKIMRSRKGLEAKGFSEKIVDTAKSWIPNFIKPKNLPAKDK